MIGTELASKIEFVCFDMWQPYLKVIHEKCSQALHILDRFHSAVVPLHVYFGSLPANPTARPYSKEQKAKRTLRRTNSDFAKHFPGSLK
jgi:hypothetical protein